MKETLGVLLNQSSEVVFSTDLQGTITDCNPAFEILFDLPRNELIGRDLRVLFKAPPDQGAQAFLQELSETPGDEVVLENKSGQEVHLSVSLSVIKDEAGDPDAYLGFVRDISDRKRSEREMEAIARVSQTLNQNLDLETIFSQIVEEAVVIIPKAVRTVIHLYDEKNQRLHAVALSSSEQGAIQTKTLIHIHVSSQNEYDFGELSEQDIQAASMSFGKGVAGLVVADRQAVIIDDALKDPRFIKGGQASVIRSMVVVPILSDQKCLGTLSVLGVSPQAFDLADKALLERFCLQAAIALENARLLESERRQRKLAEAQAEIVALLNQSLELEEVLAAILSHTLNVFSVRAANIMLVEGDSLQMYKHTGYGVPEERMAVFTVSISDGPTEDLLLNVYHSGEKFLVSDTHTASYWNAELSFDWVRCYACVPLKQGQEVIGLLNVDSEMPDFFKPEDLHRLEAFANSASAAVHNARLYADLADALRMEQETRAQLTRADKLAGMGRMVASVAHELNNPLQTIKNCLFLIEQTDRENEDTELLDLAMSEVARLSSIVNRLRDVYRPVASVDYQPSALLPLFADLEMLLETHLRRNNVRLEVKKDDLEQLAVIGYADQLKQVFLNLCLNAIEAMQPDGGTLILATQVNEQKQQVGISFTDTGPGIPEHELKYIFDPFFTTKDTGMGLGLSICYDIVHNHNGQISAQNNPQGGVTFTVWLPRGVDDSDSNPGRGE